MSEDSETALADFPQEFFANTRESIYPLLGALRRPPILYHFTTLGGMEGILRSKAIWASDIRFLNDSVEYNYATALTEEVFEKLDRVRFALLHETWKEVRSNLLTTRIFVASFCIRGDTLGQWRGYSDGGVGFSVGIRRRNAWLVGPKRAATFYRCVYDVRAQRQLITTALKGPLEVYERLAAVSGANKTRLREQMQIVLWVQMMLACAAIKHPAFREEQEWRCIIPNIVPGHSPVLVRAGEKTPIPYTVVQLGKPDAKIEIPHIVVGPNPHSELAVPAVRDLCLQHGIRIRRITRSSIPFRTW